MKIQNLENLAPEEIIIHPEVISNRLILRIELKNLLDGSGILINEDSGKEEILKISTENGKLILKILNQTFSFSLNNPSYSTLHYGSSHLNDIHFPENPYKNVNNPFQGGITITPQTIQISESLNAKIKLLGDFKLRYTKTRHS
ncbi:hypothetical protein A2483_02875 [Candidatus Peregrinibacteria bacterium RIFOXYC2_FULL_33_13]|nr:MAG: hypothetical protein UR27_C0015G0029 [Candidatus Peregrinibacteria bacterium GW2011_GWA2_33_10]KKP39531.1 MAG: hypothetical protein UR30_C0010G0027 [Candidatus Peregrinibacteria bacterium GW2011_GWC2_33_13]OGJ46659.1 MAG: hypothetical protein A2229_04565 [Candidatus Peregrinibacteria bacterium RIFOXYA2_FULL_33_7]OGJ54214.1 MAG: hypothetical protein A2483_02875 [Candidatus Peregrinibacteria bacterium RIFOXYC2_FULL_33_13]